MVAENHPQLVDDLRELLRGIMDCFCIRKLLNLPQIGEDSKENIKEKVQRFL